MSVTALGARADHVGAAAGQVVAYLEGGQAGDLTRAGSRSAGGSAGVASPGGYYSDAGQRAGRWRGEGAEHLGPQVEGEVLRRVLLGQDPATGMTLVSAQGSSGRAAGRRSSLPPGPADELFSLGRAADAVGVDVSYLRRLAARTAIYRSESVSSTTGLPAPSTTGLTSAIPSTGGAWLDAVKVDGRWQVSRAEVERFSAARRQPQVVVGYDVTFSAPKSLSILWASGDPAVQRMCEDVFEAGVARGVAYLESRAVWARRGRGYETAGGMIAASYRHDTNRELEPQLHEHVVVANMARNANGQVQAIDGRGLFAHATTAGYLAQAEMQHLSNRLGLAWTPTARGIANVAGVPDAAIRAMSTRREQVLTLAAELGSSSTHARQTAAVATRAPKDRGVDPTELRDGWRRTLAAVGFGPEELAKSVSAPPPRAWTVEDSLRLDRHLAGPGGVTEFVAIFDRRDVIQAIVDHTGGRLSGDEIEAHADRWLHSDAVIPLAVSPFARGETIGQEGKVALAADAVYYSTPSMIAVEQSIAAAWEAGHDTGSAMVPWPIVEQAIARWEQDSGFRLGDDQRAMVQAICRSGDRFQAVVGPAGTGKTAALEVAARAWEAAGYRVLGAAVNGTAAEVLGRSTGIETRTVAGLLTKLDNATSPIIDRRTVVLLDEASTLGNRQHARLARHLQASGAALRAVGDPAQHAAVEAGGMWAHLARRWPDRTPKLTVNRRQAAENMADVRLAGAEYRNGQIAAALERLDHNQRIITAPTGPELLDRLAADWYVDRQHGGTTSRMIAEHHSERRALNARAQALLKADGTLTGHGVLIGEATFHVGDEVIASAQNRQLRPAGADRNSYIRNGNTGTITAIKGKPGAETLTVHFPERGTVTVPHDWLTAPIRPGVVGGLAPAYAVTSHAAQGDTYRSGRMLANDASQPQAVYVGLTRGTQDTRIYTVKRDPATIDTDPQLPRLDDPRTPIEALTDQLTKPKPTDLATQADHDIAQLVLHTRRPLRDLERDPDPLAQRAARIVTDRITHHATHQPNPATLAELGPRTTHPDPPAWDRASTAAALYRTRWDISGEAELLPPLQSRVSPAHTADHARTTQAVTDANAARLAALRTTQLAAIRRDLVARLHKTPNIDPRLAHANIERAERLLAYSQHDHRATEAEIRRHARLRGEENASAPPAELRHRLDAAANTVANAEAGLRAARRAVGGPFGRVRDDILARIANVDRVLEPRIRQAVELPASYLTEVLGPRTTDNAARWDRAATAIEHYRHATLGIDPGHHLPNRNGLEAAIGPRRTDSTVWDQIDSLAQWSNVSSDRENLLRLRR